MVIPYRNYAKGVERRLFPTFYPHPFGTAFLRVGIDSGRVKRLRQVLFDVERPDVRRVLRDGPYFPVKRKALHGFFLVRSRKIYELPFGAEIDFRFIPGEKDGKVAVVVFCP